MHSILDWHTHGYLLLFKAFAPRSLSQEEESQFFRCLSPPPWQLLCSREGHIKGKFSALCYLKIHSDTEHSYLHVCWYDRPSILASICLLLIHSQLPQKWETWSQVLTKAPISHRLSEKPVNNSLPVSWALDSLNKHQVAQIHIYDSLQQRET